jgi:OmpA-OmpF porin, OOP family
MRACRWLLPLFSSFLVMGVHLPVGQAQSPAPKTSSGVTANPSTTTTTTTDKKPADVPPKPKKNEDPGRYGATIGGLTGLFRVVTGDIGGKHHFRIALNNEIFQASRFLVGSETNPATDDTNTRFIGTLSASYSPWQYLEFLLNVRSQTNRNERVDPSRQDQEVVLALGDWSLGGKFQYPLTSSFALGVNLNVNFLNAVGGVAADGSATGAYVGALASFDLDPIAGIPLRFHLNAGMNIDNSSELTAFPSNYSLASLQVEKFALGIKPSRMQIKIAADFETRRWLGFGLRPILEFNIDVATGDPDPDFNHPRFVGTNRPLEGLIDGRTTAWMTLGAKVNPLRGLSAHLAFDIGLQSPGYGHGPPVVPWNMLLGFSYAVDPFVKPMPPKIITKEVVKTVVKTVAPKLAKLAGRIVDSESAEPIEGAIVTFPGRDLTGLASDPDGSFLSYGFPPGRLAVMIRHAKYRPAKMMVEIAVEKKKPITIKLIRAEPPKGKVQGKALDGKGQAIAAKITISGPENKVLPVDALGGFTTDLPPGNYSIQAEATGYPKQTRPLQIIAGQTTSIDLTLKKRTGRSLVRMTKRSIRIRRKVHFATGTATLLQDSKQLLDEVAEALSGAPEVLLVEIGGHTDNRGSKANNMRLSQSRADAVLNYLVQAGVKANRLKARGYGPSRPKAPNITPRHRARNRRVEFRIKKRK